MTDLSVSLNIGPLDKFSKEFFEEASKAVRKTAFFIEGQAAIACPVDTGALRASIYTVTFESSGYSQATDQADMVYWSNKVGADTSAGMPLSPEFPRPEDPLTAVVAVGMSYGIYVEYGTKNTPARPFMGTASVKAVPFLQKMVSEAIANAAKNGGWTPQ